jgi:hypothetical protein
MEEQRAEIDQTLGKLDEMHQSGPSMPRLDRVAPSIPARDLVLRATRADGRTVVETSTGVFEVRGVSTSRSRRATAWTATRN